MPLSGAMTWRRGREADVRVRTDEATARAAAALMRQEVARFLDRRPRQQALAAAPAAAGFLDRVPLHWMLDWPVPVPLVIERAEGCALTDIDGNTLVDLCLGDTAAMFGHGPAPVRRALAEAGTRGLAVMLPSADAGPVGALLAERFGLPFWQMATTASDANRFAIRLARAVTGRRKILVFDGCYHGAVDDTLVNLTPDGRTIARASLLGQVVDTGATTLAIPFNDPDALSAALSGGDVAVVLAEPVMTNCGMILPAPGFLDFLRAETARTGTLLLLDETHTLSSGLGGHARGLGLTPDLFVAGKAVAGGVPCAIWGMTADVAARFRAVRAANPAHGHSGIGTTLSGSALQLACLKAALTEIHTPETYARMSAGADRIAAGLASVIAAAGRPWHVARVGARIEVVFAPQPVRDAAAARAASRPELEAALHLALLNRGFLLTPFHNMALVAPVLSDAEADGFVAAYAAVLADLAALEADA